MSAVLAWLASQGFGMVLGALAKLALDAFNEHQSNKALREAGAASTAAKVNAETVEMQDAVGSVPRPTDDAVDNSLRRHEF